MLEAKTIRSMGQVVGSKVSAVELEQIKNLVSSGVYLNTSDFVRDAIRDKLAAIKTIKYRDIDYDTAKKEVMGYFQERSEAYPSDIEEDLELDYKLVCQIVEELKREGRLELL
jgi:hypothetical protein